MKLVISLAIILYLTIATADAFRNGRRSNNNRRQNVGLGTNSRSRESPRLFDEFLIMVVTSGKVPDMYKEEDYAMENANPAEQQPEPTHNGTRSEIRSSMRNYIRHHRGQSRTEAIQQTLQVESENTNSENSTEQESESSRPVASQNLVSGVVEPLRSHSRRNIDTELTESLRGISREHWSCCLLGSLAGDKGFYCDASLYATRMLDRAPNRVYNRRMAGRYFTNGAPTESGSNLLTSFNGCVSNDSDARDFTRCCDETRQQYDERRTRYRRFAEAIASA